MRYGLIGVGLLGGAICAPGAVFAQAASEGVTGESGGATLEEIVVTAQKREERLQGVPIAITAVTAQAVERQGGGVDR